MMTKLDEDVVVVETVPGYVWELRLKDENAQPGKNADSYGRKGLLKRIFQSIRSYRNHA